MAIDPFDTEERRALRALAADFTAQEIVPCLADWEDAGMLPLSLHRRAAEAGLLGIGFPEDLGGSGGDLVDVVVMTEALLESGASGGIIAGLFSHGIALPHVVDEVRRREAAGDSAGAAHLADGVIRPVLSGQAVAALAVTEPEGGSDVGRLRTRARRRNGGGWCVSGAKAYITSGVRADIVVAAVRTEDTEGAAGITLMILDPRAEGYAAPRELAKMGWHCSDTAELSFDDVPVEDIDVLGEGRGFASLARHFVSERLSIAVTAYSTGQRALDLAVSWSRDRETFGRPLAQRQVVRHTLVEMHRRVDVARRYTRDAVVRHLRAEADGVPEPGGHLSSGVGKRGGSADPTATVVSAALAKQTAVEACEFAVDRAVQLHGGLGYMRGTEVERHYRDARVLGIGGGSTEVMTDLVARLLDY